MVQNNIETIESKESIKQIIKEDINITSIWHAISFFGAFIFSYLIPGIIFFVYILFIFEPYVLNTDNIIVLFTQLGPLLSFLLIPVILICCYLLHLFFLALGVRLIYRSTEKKIPSKDGIIPRNIPSKTLDFYHIRSFMLKYPKYVFTKGMFPWLTNWAFNFIGSTNIGKGTIIEEQVCGDKYIDIGKNCFIGPNSILASHMVDGIYGNISYFKIKIGDNVTFTGQNAIAPGTEINDNSYLLPMASASKFNVLKGNNYYYGIPLRKIFKSKIQEYLQITKDELNMDKSLREEQSYKKNEKKEIEQKEV